MKVNLFFLTLFLAGLLPCCKKESAQTAVTSTSTDIKEIKSSDWRKNIGKEFEVEGILIDEGHGHPILYSNEQDYLINAVTPETNFINLNPEGSGYSDLKQFFGYKVKLSATLEATDDSSIIKSADFLGDESIARLKIKSPISKTSPTQYIEDPNAVDICKTVPALCVMNTHIPIVPGKYALLYSGGCNSTQAAIRFWNDIGVTYRMLLAKGFSPDNIIVVYKDGLSDKGYSSFDNIPVNYPATAIGFQAAIDLLKSRMTKADTFVLAVANHGGGNNTYNTGALFSGRLDFDKDDERGSIHDNADETICYYNDTKVCTDDDLKNYISQLRFGCMIGLLGPCYSGGLIYDLRGPNRVLISSATEFQYSWGTSTIDIFFATMVNSIGFEGLASDPFDLNHDGQRTINETFVGMVFGTQQNNTNQQPQYCDDVSGEYTASPSSSGYGSTIVW